MEVLTYLMSKCVHHEGNVLIKSYLISTADHLTHSNSSFHFEFHKKKWSISVMLSFLTQCIIPFAMLSQSGWTTHWYLPWTSGSALVYRGLERIWGQRPCMCLCGLVYVLSIQCENMSWVLHTWSRGRVDTLTSWPKREAALTRAPAPRTRSPWQMGEYNGNNFCCTLLKF